MVDIYGVEPEIENIHDQINSPRIEITVDPRGRANLTILLGQLGETDQITAYTAEAIRVWADVMEMAAGELERFS